MGLNDDELNEDFIMMASCFRSPLFRFASMSFDDLSLMTMITLMPYFYSNFISGYFSNFQGFLESHQLMQLPYLPAKSIYGH
jgi:hypothetical protein